jgi:hypothetical protein
MTRSNWVPKRPLAEGMVKVLAAMTICAATFVFQACGGGGAASNLQQSKLVAINITPTTSLLSLASNRQLTATGTYDDGMQRDITANVTWSINSQGSTTNPVTVAPTGMVTGSALGTSVVSASMGPVVGLLQMTVNSNGYKSSNMAIITVPSGTSQVDAAYLPISQFTDPTGVYIVQVVNLDADAFSNTLPVQTALLASILMPQGFVPNAAATDPNSQLVAVISYSSATVVIIDGSNDPTDLASNTIVATYTAPVSSSVSFNGQSCMICAIEVNPADGKAILSTAQGYYTMELTTGEFKVLSATPSLAAAPSFTLNPIFQNAATTSDPYLLSPTFGAGRSSQLQSLDLNGQSTTSLSTIGLTAPGSAVINLLANQGAILDVGSNTQAFLDLSTPSAPVPVLVQNLGICPGGPQLFDMGALGVGVGFDPQQVSPTFFLAQRAGSCVGFEIWSNTTGTPQPSAIPYGYGPLPVLPDGSQFVNGADSAAIATYTSVVDKKNYGILVNANQTWIAKVNIAAVIANASGITSSFLPTGFPIPPADINAGIAGASVVFLPTNGTVSLSALNLNFGNQPVNTTSVPSTITLTYVGAINPLNISNIGIQGANASEFAETNTCVSPMAPKASCTITVTFTPSAQGARSATLAITDDGGNSPQTVALSGTGS